jgi:hypothetical protein
MLNKKPRRKFKAITFTKIEKKKFKVDYKEESFKDLDKRIHYPISSAYRAMIKSNRDTPLTSKLNNIDKL